MNPLNSTTACVYITCVYIMQFILRGLKVVEDHLESLDRREALVIREDPENLEPLEVG